MIVAGVMSGTSADGINVALVRITPSRSRAGMPGLHFLAHAEYPYPKQVRRTVLAAMNSSKASVADLARLNFLLAELYADAVLATQRRFRLKAELVGCHGQTLYHQGEVARFWDGGLRSPGRLARVHWWLHASVFRSFQIFGQPTWRPAARELRWFPSLIFFCTATTSCRPNRAKHWWDRELDCDPGERVSQFGSGFRHRSGQYAD